MQELPKKKKVDWDMVEKAAENLRNSKQESLDDILWPRGYGGKPLSITVDDGIGGKILQKPYSLLKNQLQAYCNKQVIEELESLLKTKRQPIMMIGTPFSDGVVSSKSIENRIKELKEK